MISYSPFGKTLENKNLLQYQLIHEYHFSTDTLDAINKSITLNTLHDICDMIDCDIFDIAEFIREQK